MSKFCMGCMEPFEDRLNICPHCGYAEDTSAEEALHMEPGSVLHDRYIIGRVLGFGGFGVTYLGWDATLEQKVAIKEYLPSEFSTRIPGQTQITVYDGDKAEQFADGLSNFVEEAQRLAKFHSEAGIVRIFDSFETNNTAYIVMEYLQGETLAEYLKREKKVPADTAIEMLLPVIHSLQAVNGQGIIHRDIAPDNIFLTHDGKVKLIDFGAARFATTSHSRSLTVIIKPGYSPEEQYRSRGDQGPYTDVYAIGATLYRMVTGATPPDALERRAQFESKKKDILKPIDRFTKDITENQEVAILNALNVRIEDRTQDMATLAKELTTEEPEKVTRLYGKIKKIDVLKWPLWAKLSTAAAMLSVITLSTLFAFGIIGFDALLQTAIAIPDDMSRVPSIVNNDLPQARERLDNATLLYSIVGREYSDLVPADLVLTQNLSAGSVVMHNTIVEISISGGIETEVIYGVAPDVQFREKAEAIQLFAEAGFTIVDVTYIESDTVAAGLVISQDPPPGTSVAPGGAVSIIVSTGSPSFAMPNVVGMAEQAARDMLTERGLSVSIAYAQDNSVPAGTVLRQSIAPETAVSRGDQVTITVSVSNDIELVSVPNVVGRPQGEATSTLRAQGFEVTVSEATSETVPSGNVISQMPTAGSSQVSGSRVVITVSSGRAPTPTPAPTPSPTPGQTPSPTPAAIAPTISSSPLTNSIVGERYTWTIPVTGTAPITWSITSGSLPTGLSLNASTGVITGTSTTAGTFTFTVRATNSAGSDSRQFSVTISPVGTTEMPPEIVLIGALPNGTVGTTYSRTLTVVGTTPITWSISAGALPGGLSLNASTGVISGTPTTAGTFNFTVRATNSAGNDSRQMSITINPASVPTPTVYPPTFITGMGHGSGTVGVPFSTVLTVDGTTPITWSITSGTLPNGLSLNTNTGEIAGTPTTTGTFSATVQASNSAGNTSRQLSIRIDPAPTVGTAPTITTTSLPDGTVGVGYGRGLTASSDVSWGIIAGGLPDGLNRVGNWISGTPTVAGTFTFTVRASNAAGEATRQLSITIHPATPTTPVETPPTITTGWFLDGTVGVPWDGILFRTGTSPITFSISAGRLPDGLSLNASTGVISGTPTVAGTFTFTVRASNTAGEATRQLSITIHPES